MSDSIEILYRIINNGAGVEPAPEIYDDGKIRIEHPSIAVLHKLGFWPKEDVVPPEPEEGYHIIDEGYKYYDKEDGTKYVKLDIRKLLIVDEPPELAENQVIENDHWEEQGDKYVHVYPVWTVVDSEMPEVDETTHHYNGDEWVYDNENMTKTHIYHVLERVDNPPELSDDMEIVSDRWEVVDDKYVHRYEVRIIVDHPPVLEEGEQVLDFHWDDDGTYKTKVYDRIRYVVDNPPALEEGQEIVDKIEEDDGTTVTYRYEVRFIVDNPPELEEGQQIIDDHWDDDGTTRTHVYTVRFVVDEEPDLTDDQYILEDHWDDDGTTRTHVYVVITRIDNPPEVGENQELEDLGWTLDIEARTNTHNYRVWTIVDPGEPELAQDEESEDYWDVNEETLTKTHIYKVWKIIDEGPKPPSGQLYEGGMPERVKDEEAGTITLVYPYVPYPAIRVSKLALEYALGTMGKLAAFEAFIASLPDIDFGNGEVKSVKHFYETANELNTNNPLCVPYIEGAAAALGLTINEVFGILRQCAVGSQPA